MVLGEILIDGVFVAALLTSVACLVYVVYATILVRHLLRAHRSPLSAGTARVVSFPAAAPASRHGGPGSSALPAGKS